MDNIQNNQNYQNNQNSDDINNSVLKVKTLEKEYDVVLKQYQEAYKNYLNAINTSSNPCEKYKLESKGVSQECYNKIWSDQGCTAEAPTIGDWQNNQTYDGLVNDSYLWATLTDADHRKGCYGDTTEYTTKTEPTYSLGKDFTELPGRTWWGTYGIKEGPSETKDDCISMCASDNSCTGATFNPVKRYCWARGGDGTVTAGTSDDSALIPKLKGILLVLNVLNDKLMTINNDLQTETQNLKPKLEGEKAENEKKQQNFDRYYNDLYHDKLAMAKMIKDYETVNSELEDQTLFVEQENLSFKIWTILALILCLIISLKMANAQGESPTLNRIITIIFVIAIIINIFRISKPSGFAAFGFLIIALILFRFKTATN
jgi:hypothetical protein